MKRNLVELEIPVGLAWMIGDDGCRYHLEFAGAPAIQDVGQAMIRGRDQQHELGGRVARSRIFQSMPKRSAMAVKPVCSEARSTARSAAANTTRMKKWPVSISSNCWASRMFCPLWARNVETAETMPGRSGQESVNTY